MQKTRPAPAKQVYPRPGSHAETILNFVVANPGTTTNGVISGLSMNPSVVRKCLTVLLERGRIEDRPDDKQHHHYTAKDVAL